MFKQWKLPQQKKIPKPNSTQAKFLGMKENETKEERTKRREREDLSNEDSTPLPPDKENTAALPPEVSSNEAK